MKPLRVLITKWNELDPPLGSRLDTACDPSRAPAIQLSLRYSNSRIACLRASLTSLAALRSSASIRRLVVGEAGSAELHVGQTLAKPGLSGFSSNSSAHTEQIFVGKAITFYDTTLITRQGSGSQLRADWLSSPLRDYQEVNAIRAGGTAVPSATLDHI